MPFVHCNLLDSKWANIKARFVNKDDWKELDDAEIKNNWTAHSGCLLM